MLRVKRDGPVATIVLDNPGMRNAITADMWRRFPFLLTELAADDDVLVLVVRGASGNFSAGADIADLARILHDPATGRRDGGDVTAAEEALATFPKPTVAAIEGYCVGGGWQIAGACDIRLASGTAVVGITPANLGIVYPLSGIRRLVGLVGPAAAKYLLFSAELLTADDASRLGLLTSVEPVETFETAVSALAGRLASRSQFSARAHKDLIDAIADGATDVAERSAYWQHEMEVGPDAEIGVGAFLAKAEPAFTWRRPVEE
ncbi:enoyl-CoA hydratase/isomerase family protein [Specibacter cremeus]|uniref:enoyl-CoA hydratase/isomerase family protein n=1 Tax=Specibacter cremeus TaxID=1629051 RepID=UPI000F76DD41|nr:enoyl-CoA hydratase/isomerase family protein [Specibacter cremeus]